MFRKEESESISEQEFHALYKPGNLPIFVIDLVYMLTGEQMSLPEMADKIKI